MDSNVEQFMDKLQSHLNIKIILYGLCLFFYIVSFHYIFKESSAQYMAWILAFVVNAAYPFIWLGDYTNLIKVIPSGHEMISYFYSSICLFATLLLQFILLIFVISKNENVRKHTKYLLHKNEDTINKNDSLTTIKEKEDALKTKNRATVNEKNFIETPSHHLIKRDKIIKKMFIANTVMIWCMVSYIFAKYLHRSEKREDFPVGGSISWWINNVFVIAIFLDTFFYAFFKSIYLPPLVKAFVVFCITFIGILFSCFLRIRLHKNHDKYGYHIVNIQNPFTRKFERRINQYKDLTMFFFASFISIIIFLVIAFICYLMGVEKSGNIVSGIGSIATIIIFALFYKKKNAIFKTVDKLKECIFFFLCLIFGIVGTPVAVTVVEILLLMFDRSLGRQWVLGWVSGILFFFLTIFLFTYGKKEGYMRVLKSRIDERGLIHTRNHRYYKQNWIKHDDDVPFKTFIAILISMAIGVFMGLATEYPMFKFLHNVIGAPIWFVLKYLAPLAIVALAIVQFIFAYKNFQVTKYTTDG
jgi:hypothetical protein